MTEEATRYARVQSILGDALDRPADARATFLDAACGDDDALRAEVEELLALSTADDDALGDAALDAARRALHGAVDDALVARDGEWIPERIGDYRVVRKLGQGGMGVVYEAEQASPHRRVAIKLLHPMLATPDRLRRFRQEAAVLGRLTHPGIAQVFEAGTADTERGTQSFLVMELVEGRDLRTHCDRNGLDRRARIALLAEVAEAIHHAHEHGVVHRDLKPDNVLVDAHGHPRILDFGIARVEGGSATLSTIVTEEGQLVGTLAYMAPEQLEPARGAATRQVDVYALGVLGFELLVGRLPHDVVDLSLSQAITLLTTRDVPRAGRLAPDLRGDLETILGKALEPETSRRYPTAAAFAADLRRHLDHRPIRARPPSRIYLARKFTRRHRGLVAGAVATVLALVAGTIISLGFADDAAEQRDAARLSERKAVNGVLQSAQVLLDTGNGRRVFEQLQLVPEDRRGLSWRLLRRAAPALLDVPFGPWIFRGDTHMVATVSPPGGLAPPELVEVSLESGEVTWRAFPELIMWGIDQATSSGVVVVAVTAPAKERRRAVLDTTSGRVIREGPTPVWEGEYTHVASSPKAGQRSGFQRPLLPEISDDGRTLLWFTSPTHAELLVDGEVVQTLEDLGPDAVVHLSPDGTTFARSEAGRVTVRDVRDGAARFAYADPDGDAIAAFPVEGGVLLADGQEGANEVPPVRWRRLELGPPGRPSTAEDPFAGVQPAFPHPVWPEAWWPRDGRFVAVADRYAAKYGFVVDTVTGAGLPSRHLTATPERDGALFHGQVSVDPKLPVSPDGSRLAIVNTLGSVELVELDPRESEPAFDPRGRVLRGHEDARGNRAEGWVYHVAVSPDGSLIASAAPADPLVRVWDARTGEPLATLERSARQPSSRDALLAFDATGDRLVVSTPWPERGLAVADWHLVDGTVELPVADRPLDTPHLTLVDGFLDALGSREPVTLGTTAALHDGRVLASYLPEGGAGDPSTRWAIPNGPGQAFAGLGVHPSGTLVAIATQVAPGAHGVGSVLIVDVHKKEVLHEIAIAAKPWCAAFHPDGSLLAIGTQPGHVLLFETETWTRELDWPAHDEGETYNYVKALAWTPDGTRLLTASGDATVRVWDSRTRVAARVEDEAWRALRASMAARDDLAEVYETLAGDERAAARAELLRRRSEGDGAEAR